MVLIFWHQLIQSERGTSEGASKLAVTVVFSCPRAQRTKDMQGNEFQAMTHLAGRTAAPSGTQSIQTPAQRQRQAPP